MIVARSASPANTRSTSARSRSLGVTLLDTDVGSLPRLLGRYERNLRPSFIYTRAETRPRSSAHYGRDEPVTNLPASPAVADLVDDHVIVAAHPPSVGP